MPTPTARPQTIDDYIAAFPPDVQAILQQVRAAIRQAAPAAGEAIKYGIPTFTLNGNVLSFAAYQHHIGLYPIPAGTQKLRRALAPYQAAKSSLHFPLDQPVPYDLISQVARYRVKEHLAAVAARGKK